jgi:hypothetical protein
VTRNERGWREKREEKKEEKKREKGRGPRRT